MNTEIMHSLYLLEVVFHFQKSTQSITNNTLSTLDPPDPSESVRE